MNECRTFAVRALPWGRTAATAALLVVLAASLPLPAAAAAVPPGRHLRADGHVALVWLYGGSSADYRAQIDAAVGLSVISPTWWYLDSDDPGGVTLATDDDLVAYAHDRGIAVWPLLGNHIDPDLTDQVLRDDALRARLVQEVVAEARRSGVDGVNVDFENLHDATSVLLTQFVADLKAALPDLIISVDVTAMTDSWVLGNWSTAFDREGLGQVADYVMLMAYDQHNSLRRDGPVAGLTWVRESTEFLLRTVPPGKLVLGLPFYSRDWAENPEAPQGVALDATLGMAAMGRRMAERSQQVVYDEVAAQDLHTYVDAEGRTHRVWLEDIASLQRKTELVTTYGLAGIAAWRGGFEPGAVWSALDAQLASAPPPGARVLPAVQAEPPPSPTAPAENPTAPAENPTARAEDPAATPEPATPLPTATATVAATTPDADAPALMGTGRWSWLAVAAALLGMVAIGHLLHVGGRRRRP